MDGINNISGTQGIQPPNNQIQIQPDQGKKHPPPPPLNVQLTQLGQLFSAGEESGESAKNELKQFKV